MLYCTQLLYSETLVGYFRENERVGGLFCYIFLGLDLSIQKEENGYAEHEEKRWCCELAEN